MVKIHSLVASSLLAAITATLPPVFASEEEFLPWKEVRIICAERDAPGTVELRAHMVGNEYATVAITAFGKKHELAANDLKKLREFPLQDLRLTHEAGYEELGGHTVHLRLHRTFYEAGQLVEEMVIVSVSKGKGLFVNEPRRRVLQERRNP